MTKKSSIQIDVTLDDQKMPENITWRATDSFADRDNEANGLLLSIWENSDNNALRIDLWTKKMMVNEMADFYYQTFLGMADTFFNATKDEELQGDIKKFAMDFLKKFRSKQQPAGPEKKRSL